jgi:hypothetical protein
VRFGRVAEKARALDRAREGLVAAHEEHRPVGHGQVPLLVPLELGRHGGEQLLVEHEHFDLVDLVDRLPLEGSLEEAQRPVRHDRDLAHGLHRLVQPVGRRHADLDPMHDASRGVAHADGGFVRFAQAAAEGDALLVAQAVAQHARHEEQLGLRRVHGRAQLEGLVDAAIRVGEVDGEAMQQSGVGHAGRIACRASASKRAAPESRGPLPARAERGPWGCSRRGRGARKVRSSDASGSDRRTS